MSFVISIQNIHVKSHQHKLLHNLNLTIHKGQHWLLAGQSGSGKTVLLNTIAGLFRPSSGSINYAGCAPGAIPHHISLVTSRHHFKDRTNTSSNLYYQQRYNSSDSDQALTVLEYLQNKTTALANPYWTMDKVTSLLRLEPLINKELIKLSNGETKRLRLASALLGHPAILLLDDPLSGLDREMQQDFDYILDEIIASGVTVIMSGSGHEIPASVTHVATLQQGTITSTVPVGAYRPPMIHAADMVNEQEILKLTQNTDVPVYQWIVNMKNVVVKYNEHIILKRINWQIKPAERWALFGHNGAGKSTLLSLINGDNPQAYANDIVLFDQKRGTGESIWDIKRKTGFLSPELYQFFPIDQSALQVVESGYYDTQGLFRPSTAAKAARSMDWLKALNINNYGGHLLKNMPASAQRLCLLARAVIKAPALLILDEPCQGLDRQQRQHFNLLVDAIVKNSNLALIYVTHYANELPACINHTLTLQNGEVVNT